MGNRTDQRRKAGTLITDDVVLVAWKQLRCYHLPGLQNMDRCRLCTYRCRVPAKVLPVSSTVQVSVECWGVIQNTSHGESGSNVSGAKDDVALSSTSSLCDRVSISLDLEQIRPLNFSTDQRPLESMSRSKSTSSCNVRNSTLLSNLVDGSDDFAVDLSKNLGGENVCEFSFSIQTVDCSQVLSQLQAVLCLQSTGLSGNGDFLD